MLELLWLGTFEWRYAALMHQVHFKSPAVVQNLPNIQSSHQNRYLLVQVKWLHAMNKGCHSGALHYACTNGHVAVADWLHENCSVCQEWTESQPGPHLLAFLENWRATQPSPAPIGMKMLKWLLEKYELADTLYHLLANAVIAGDEECFGFLISQPEQFHQAARQSNRRLPPLMELAVRYGRTDMLPALSKFTGTLTLVGKTLNSPSSHENA